MGFFKNVRTKYQELDTKLGGILPGKGNERAAAQAVAPQPTPSVPFVQPTTQPTDVSTGESRAPSPFEASRTPNTSTEQGPVFSQGIPTPIEPQQSAGYSGDSKILQAVDWYFSDKNPAVKYFGNVPEQDAQGNVILDDYQTPAIAGFGGIARKGGNVLQVLKGKVSIKDLLKIRGVRKAQRELLVESERVGNRIAAQGGIVKVGDKIAGTNRLYTNAKEVEIVNKIIVDTARRVSPTNWKKILGVGALVAGIPGAAVFSVWSGAQKDNYVGDSIQQLSIAQSQMYSDGNIEEGDAVGELMKDVVAYDNSLSSKIPWYNRAKGLEIFMTSSLEANKLKKELADKKRESEEIIQSLIPKLNDETITDYELGMLEELDPDNFNLADYYKDVAETEVADTGLAEGDALRDRILSEGQDGGLMTDEQIVNDPAIRTFALDSRNSFGPIAKIYQQALARYIAGGGASQGDSQPATRNEPGSTLGFGLLNTGSQQVPVEPTQEPQVSPQPTNPSLPGARDERIDDGTQTQTGFPPNTYDEATHTYTDSQGQGYSMAQAPPGVRIL